MLERSASADLQGPRAEGLAALKSLKSLMGDRMTDNAATCAFASLDGAVQILVETLQVGVPIARIEILDTRQVQAINAYYAARALRPDSSLIVTDVCVPISRLTECITQTHEDIAQVGLDAPIVGHVGDGNFHVMICVDPDNAEEVHRAEAFNDRLVARALDGWHLYWRTRHRHWQARQAGRRIGRRRCRPNASDQARNRPAGHFQSG